jgi:hypothetical protein
MPDRDLSTIRDLIYYWYATIIAKSAFAASDGESKLKHSGDKKFCDSIPPLLPSAAATTAQGTLGTGDLDGDDEITVRDIDWVLRSGGGRFDGGS